jgi:hypothetical protein
LMMCLFLFATDLSSGAELINVFLAEKQDLIVVQWNNLNTETLELLLVNTKGQIVQKTELNAGSTMAYFETQTLYSGAYTVVVSNGKEKFTEKITIRK